MTYRDSMSEAELQQAIIDKAKLCGWMVMHQRPALTSKGWRTTIVGDPGFPDIVAARNGVVLLIECKSATGRMRPGQAEWLAAANGVLARPLNLEVVLALLD